MRALLFQTNLKRNWTSPPQTRTHTAKWVSLLDHLLTTARETNKASVQQVLWWSFLLSEVFQLWRLPSKLYLSFLKVSNSQNSWWPELFQTLLWKYQHYKRVQPKASLLLNTDRECSNRGKLRLNTLTISSYASSRWSINEQDNINLYLSETSIEEEGRLIKSLIYSTYHILIL